MFWDNDPDERRVADRTDRPFDGWQATLTLVNEKGSLRQRLRSRVIRKVNPAPRRHVNIIDHCQATPAAGPERATSQEGSVVLG